MAKGLNPLIAIHFYKHAICTGGKYDFTLPPESILSANRNEFGNLAAVSPCCFIH